jgi:hypothetical protein
MAERKKVEQKPIVNKLEPKKRVLPTIEPKKRAVPIPLPVIEPKVEAKEPTKEVKPKRVDKYVRLALDAEPEERKQISNRVEKGELTLAYYATDNDKGYHYYIVNKN